MLFCLSLRDKRLSEMDTQAWMHTSTHRTRAAACIHHMSGLKCFITKGEFIPGLHCKYNSE